MKKELFSVGLVLKLEHVSS